MVVENSEERKKGWITDRGGEIVWDDVRSYRVYADCTIKDKNAIARKNV